MKVKLKEYLDSLLYKKQKRIIELQRKKELNNDEVVELSSSLDVVNVIENVMNICEDRGRY